MSVTQPPTDAPFGLQPNVAAGLAYLLCLVGGIVMLVGGGTNKFVKWAAAQSIVLWVALIIVWWAVGFLYLVSWPLAVWLHGIVDLVWFVLWIWTFVSGFQGKEVRVPVIAGIAESLFKSSL